MAPMATAIICLLVLGSPVLNSMSVGSMDAMSFDSLLAEEDRCKLDKKSFFDTLFATEDQCGAGEEPACHLGLVQTSSHFLAAGQPLPSSQVFVIGAGAAGSLLAAQLSRAGKSTAVFNPSLSKGEGPLQLPGVGVIFNGRGDQATWKKLDPLLSSDESRGCNKHCAAFWDDYMKFENYDVYDSKGKVWNQGRGLGGTSVTALEVFLKGSRSYYDSLGDGMSWEEAEKMFNELTTVDGGSETHKLAVTTQPKAAATAIEMDFVKMLTKQGIPEVHDGFNGGTPLGVGRFHLMQEQNGLAANSFSAFLKPALSSNKHLSVNHGDVKKLVFYTAGSEKVVTGLVMWDGKEVPVPKGAEVVLCAGVFQTPAILLRSGVGPKQALDRLGVDQVLDLAVGQTFREQPKFTLAFKADGVANPLSEQLLRDLIATQQHYTRGNVEPVGQASNNFHAYGAYIDLDNDLSADIMLFLDATFHMSGEGVTEETAAEIFKPGFGIEVVLLQPKSTGWVSLANQNQHWPQVEAQLLSHPDDLLMLTKGVKLVREMFHGSEYFKKQNYREVFPGSAVSNDELSSFVQQHIAGNQSPVGTAALGQVLNSDFRVKGTANLKVVDASIHPKMPDGRTLAPTYLLAMKAAHAMFGKQGHSHMSKGARL